MDTKQRGFRTRVSAQALLYWLMLGWAAVLLFYRLGTGDVKEWDEARNGVNAFEMLQNGDFLNLHYGGEPDSWNTKPPLAIWLTALSYTIFGTNEWALRMPSAVCGVLFFALLYHIVVRWAGRRTALTTCAILLCCKAVVDHHVFRTGDFDGPLLLALTASVHAFWRYAEEGRRGHAYGWAAATGLAFWIKGPAAFVLLPGMAVYAVVAGILPTLLRRRATWGALGLLIAIVGVWCAAIVVAGARWTHSEYGSGNALSTLFFHDTLRRLGDEEFSAWKARNPACFFLTLEARMNLWHVVFYGACALGLVQMWKARHTLRQFLRLRTVRPLLYSVSLILPLAVLLSVASAAHDWYIVPVLPYVAFLTAAGCSRALAR